MTSSRQAVVLIHGIGEQRPMDTVLDSFELRRLTTCRGGNRVRRKYVCSRTGGTAPAFSYLREIETGNEKLVAQIFPRWNRVADWLREAEGYSRVA
jgi:hypothetical protein